jgi:hypothetical protein
MPTTYPVRRLIKSARPLPEGSPDFRDPFANGARMAGAVYDVSAEELRLTSREVVQWLDGRNLRTTDLVMIDGTWTTIAESIPFYEAAEPHAKRERRIRNLKSALLLFLSLAAFAAVFAFRMWLHSLYH